VCNKGITQFYLPATHEPFLPAFTPQPQGITALWLVPTFTAWWTEAHRCDKLAQSFYARPRLEPTTSWSQVRHSTDSATTPPAYVSIDSVFDLISETQSTRWSVKTWGITCDDNSIRLPNTFTRWRSFSFAETTFGACVWNSSQIICKTYSNLLQYGVELLSKEIYYIIFGPLCGLVRPARWHNDCDTQATYGSVMALRDLAAYQRYAIQASATNYYVDQWRDEPVRGQVFVFRTRAGSEFTHW